MPQPTSVLHEILSWSLGESPWIGDALGKIIREGGCSDQDVKDYVSSALGELDVAKFRPLSLDDLPPEPGVEDSITLVSLGNLKGINRLAPRQVLDFGSGLTVVFGNNGAGKSGYARVLKKACRTRGSALEILGDKTDATVMAQSAEVCYKRGASTFPVSWALDTTPDPQLANVFVFDSLSANHYVTKADEPSFTPFGLDIFPGLIKVVDRVRAGLEAKKIGLQSEVTAFLKAIALSPTSPTGQAVHSLSATSDKGRLKRLATVPEEDKARRVLLEKTLSADPDVETAKLKGAVKRLREFQVQVRGRLNQLGPESMGTCNAKVTDWNAAHKAVTAFRTTQYTTARLPETGNPGTWVPLWNAARDYSQSAAYPDEVFPKTTDGALCVLCQQPLDELAQARLADFTQSMQGALEREFRTVDTGFQTLQTEWSQKVTLASGLKAVVGDIEGQEPILVPGLKSLVDALDAQLLQVKATLEQKQAVALAPVNTEVLTLLDSLIIQLDERIFALATSGDPLARAKQVEELADLKDRELLVPILDSALEAIGKLTRVKEIDEALKANETGPMSKKSGALTKQFVTETFQTRFREELTNLGLRTIHPELLPGKNPKGSVQFGLTIAGVKTSELNQVASEGEQRCIALACFLAELSQASHRSTILFDDPVSSLDHDYQRQVAQRLSVESQHRQVIVFTHDVGFLRLLMESQRQHGQTPTKRSVQWHQDKPGQVLKEFPWFAQDPKDQLKQLRQAQLAMKVRWNAQPNDDDSEAMRHEYSRFRAVVERVVELTLFGGIVNRFSERIDAGNVHLLAELPLAVCKALKDLYQRTHGIVDAHGGSLLSNNPVPHPDVLEADIAMLESLIQQIQSHRNQRSTHA